MGFYGMLDRAPEGRNEGDLTELSPVEPATLGYAIVRLAEAFLFNDAVAGMRGDVDRLREVEAAILGVNVRNSEAMSRP
jgi:hypothetical protein